jgi:hypothetical protein
LQLGARFPRKETSTQIKEAATALEQTVQLIVGTEIEEVCYTIFQASLAQKSRQPAGTKFWAINTACRHEFRGTSYSIYCGCICTLWISEHRNRGVV